MLLDNCRSLVPQGGTKESILGPKSTVKCFQDFVVVCFKKVSVFIIFSGFLVSSFLIFLTSSLHLSTKFFGGLKFIFSYNNSG